VWGAADVAAGEGGVVDPAGELGLVRGVDQRGVVDAGGSGGVGGVSGRALG